MNNKKSFKYIENRIKQAAQNSHASYQEQAWKKMEALLNKEEKKRRPFSWWWLLLPLILGGLWGVYKLSQPSLLSENKPGKIVKRNTTVQQKINPFNKQPMILPADDAIVSGPFDKAAFSGSTILNPARRNSHMTRSFPEKKSADIKEKIIGNQSTTGEKETVGPSIQNVQNDRFKNTILKATEKIKDNNTAGDIKAPYHTKKAVKNEKGFYLLASAGADAGSVKLLSYANSTVTAKYAVGLGYQLNNKWSIQTGLYISNKKYTAGPEDYHPKEGSYWNIVQIKKVKAVCLVYEIPLIVRYNFIQRPLTDYYGTIGIASYIMKKEKYNYDYTRNNVPYQTYREYTGNKHLFSNFSFSAGVEKKLSSTFSLMAEPSLSIPISGVGEGRVKLYSMALQIGIKYKPLKK